MDKYYYIVICCSDDTIEKSLNNLGNQGYRLVNTTVTKNKYDDVYYRCVLEKVITPRLPIRGKHGH